MRKARFYLRNRYFFALDLIFIVLAVVISFFLRLEFRQLLTDYTYTVVWMVVTALIIKPFVYKVLGLYQRFWVYASVREFTLILTAVSIGSAIVGLLMIYFRSAGFIVFFSRSIPFIDWMLSLIFTGGVRFLPRFMTERSYRFTKRGGVKHALIIGAGDAGALVVRELQKNPQLNLAPIGFLDDDPEKQGVHIHALKVGGTLDDLEKRLEMGDVDEVVIAIPSAPGQVVRRVADACRELRVPFRTMPGMYELLGGTVSVSRLREVEIADLLRREHVWVDHERVGQSLSRKRILVTGAGGSIAGELCRQIARWGPEELILLGHGENSIFEMMLDLEKNFPALPMQAVIADVRDRQRLKSIFTQYKPQVVFHAAAHKHVYLMERNVVEAVTNNILGTRNVIRVALKHNVERLVMVSTDKAVCPTSVMGATKRIAEMVVLDAANGGGEAFSVVRFGNVLGSRGSVVPLFQRQIREGGPVTVRHPDAERYFMTIPEAVHLVLQASSMGKGGEVFLLNMGQPVKIMQLAEDIIRLSGLEPGVDVEIEITGLKPGEKLTEELWDAWIETQETDHPDITRLADEAELQGEELYAFLDELIALAQAGEVDDVVRMLDEAIPGAQIRSTPPPDLTAMV